jgi:zinc/manganese transport system substrate-binding protein
MQAKLTRRTTLMVALGGMLASPLLGHANDRVPVVASFSIIGDMTRIIGGDRINLTTLVGPDGDAHVYQPTPADGKAVAEAKVVIINGLSFEGWMERLLKATATKATIITATNGVTPLEMEEAGEEGHSDEKQHDHAHDHGSVDPHAWQSIHNAKIYVANIRDALIAADPAGKASYEANALAYLAELDAVDAEIRKAIETIPAARRKIITSHDAFGYFGQAYGLQFIAPRGVSTEAEVSAKGVARIIRQIKKDKIPAIFIENISDPRIVKRISDETGAKMGGTLFSDALSDDKGTAATYIDMMRQNVKALSSALTS